MFCHISSQVLELFILLIRKVLIHIFLSLHLINQVPLVATLLVLLLSDPTDSYIIFIIIIIIIFNIIVVIIKLTSEVFMLLTKCSSH